MNGKKGPIIGSAINNRIGIQIQGENRQVSIRILNIRYQEGPGQHCRTLHNKVVDKAQAEIKLLSMEFQIQIRITGNKHVDTAQSPRNHPGSGRIPSPSCYPMYETTRTQPPQPCLFQESLRHGPEKCSFFQDTGHTLGLALLEASHRQMGRQRRNDRNSWR